MKKTSDTARKRSRSRSKDDRSSSRESGEVSDGDRSYTDRKKKHRRGYSSSSRSDYKGSTKKKHY